MYLQDIGIESILGQFSLFSAIFTTESHETLHVFMARRGSSIRRKINTQSYLTAKRAFLVRFHWTLTLRETRQVNLEWKRAHHLRGKLWKVGKYGMSNTFSTLRRAIYVTTSQLGLLGINIKITVMNSWT